MTDKHVETFDVRYARHPSACMRDKSFNTVSEIERSFSCGCTLWPVLALTIHAQKIEMPVSDETKVFSIRDTHDWIVKFILY
jgi:hypothetical protein